MSLVTCIAPVNIAVLKYWGKRDEDLILPLNDSISCTLSVDHLCAKTTILVSPNLKENKFWLNGKEESFNSKRLQNCLAEVKKRAGNSELLKWNIHICSENNFPTGAGLASSAAGFACLVQTLSYLYGVKDDVSSIARRGSGSACRSIHGGWVQWHQGTLPTGEDSIATQIVPSSHWPEMRIIILVVNDREKKYKSTSGMKKSVETSELLKYRTEVIAPRRAKDITETITSKHFHEFAELTMRDSNQFHAVCLDTYPPCIYLNDISYSIIEMVHAYNNHKGENKLAYTFDAGPNACLFLLEQELEEVTALINELFPSTTNFVEYFKGHPVAVTPSELKEQINLTPQRAGALKYVIHTRVGDGPKILSDSNDHLLAADGLPKVH